MFNTQGCVDDGVHHLEGINRKHSWHSSSKYSTDLVSDASLNAKQCILSLIDCQLGWYHKNTVWGLDLLSGF